jgi:hypothetical protein
VSRAKTLPSKVIGDSRERIAVYVIGRGLRPVTVTAAISISLPGRHLTPIRPWTVAGTSESFYIRANPPDFGWLSSPVA